MMYLCVCAFVMIGFQNMVPGFSPQINSRIFIHKMDDFYFLFINISLNIHYKQTKTKINIIYILLIWLIYIKIFFLNGSYLKGNVFFIIVDLIIVLFCLKLRPLYLETPY